MKYPFFIGAFALTALVLVPVTASPQSNAELRSTSELVIDLDRSEQLFEEASGLGDASDNLVKAADRYVQSARLRPYGDEKAYVALNRAGQMFSHAGRTGQARRAFAEAGVRAMETGQVFEAAMAYANAAELSQRDRDSDRMVLDFVRIAHRLSESPGLTDEQRLQVHNRLGLTTG